MGSLLLVVVVSVSVCVSAAAALVAGHHAQGDGHGVVVLVHGRRRRHLVRLRLVDEAVRHGRGGEDVVGGGGPLVGEPLHPLHVQPVLLQVARHVLPRQPFHVHQLHDRLGHRLLDPQVRHHVHEPLVQLRRPHQPGPLRRVVDCVCCCHRCSFSSTSTSSYEGLERRPRRRAPQPRHRGRRRAVHVKQRPPGLRRDAEGGGQPRRDQRLRKRGQLLAAGEASLPLHHPLVIGAAQQVQVQVVVVRRLLAHPRSISIQ
ncbi:hypothetical protein PVAP13_5NG647001 [Panicum virgatum]|uniref:Secreted protein n=1 Tax=Panicum virgatum TaxID=38727 RepID=A0A8T0SBF7_PANVG|nr:hypothetical protein PVAP13_5NG647001 [Panicum virgatum]